MFIIGLNQGTQPIIGFNFGARNFGRMFMTLKLGAIIGTCFTTFGFIVGTFFSHQVVTLFTKDIELQNISAQALRISVIMFPVVGILIVISNFFQSISKAKISIFLSLTRQFLFFIPGLYILPSFWGLNGAWAVMPFSDGLASLVAIISYVFFYRRFKHNDF